MPAMFNQGFFVREPAWHGMGNVLESYPDRATAMRLAGHDWDIEQRDLWVESPADDLFHPVAGHRLHVRSDNGDTLGVLPDTYEPIPNSIAYDVAEVLFDQGFQYETGITLEDGRSCAITLRLDQPFEVGGDDSIILPYGCLSWRHDGGGALKARTGTIRQVCANTVNASELEGARLGTDFTFRHTKNVMERIEDAKEAMKGIRADVDTYRRMAEELGAMRVTPFQRDLFVSTIIGDPDFSVSKAPDVSARVKANIETERTKVLGLFMQDPGKSTIPEAHALTGYGLFLAGGEYFDHLRPYQSGTSYVRRTLLQNNPAKAALARTIRELVKA